MHWRVFVKNGQRNFKIGIAESVYVKYVWKIYGMEQILLDKTESDFKSGFKSCYNGYTNEINVLINKRDI